MSMMRRLFDQWIAFPLMLLSIPALAFGIYMQYHEQHSSRWVGVIIASVPINFTLLCAMVPGDIFGIVFGPDPSLRHGSLMAMYLFAAIGVFKASTAPSDDGGLGPLSDISGVELDRDSLRFFVAGTLFHVAQLTAIATTVLFAYLDNFYCRLPPASKAAVAVGDKLPELSFHQGSAKAQSNDWRGKYVVMVLYRPWDPLCQAFINQALTQAEALERSETKIVFASSSPQSSTPSKIPKSGAYHDANGDSAKKLGLWAPATVPLPFQLTHGLSGPLPSVLIVSPDGEIIWMHTSKDIRDRPNAEYFIHTILQHIDSKKRMKLNIQAREQEQPASKASSLDESKKEVSTAKKRKNRKKV